LSAGSGIVSLKASGRTAAHDAGVLVEVGASQAQSHHGPELTVGAASIGADASTMRTAYSLALRGDVTDALRIDAMLATQLNDDPLALRSVALLGAPVGGSRVRISGAHGAIEAGRVALRLPELGGLNMGGDGVALDWHVPDGSTLNVATARQAGAFGPGGTQAALQWSSRPAPLTLRLGASRLDERQTTGRRLDAVTADLRYAPSRRSAVSVELAERQFENGRGVGAAGEASWDRDASRGRVRVFHAPGGAAAFAMARNGAMLETQGRLGARWQAAAQAWMMGDEGFDGSALRTSGGAFSPSVRVGTRADVGLSASYVRYASGAGAAHRHDAQQELMARGGMDLGVVRWDAEAGTERSVRGSSADGQRLSEVTARSVARSSLAVPTEHGTLSVRGSFRTASTFLASEGLIDLQLAGVRPIPGFHALTIDGGVQRVYLNRTGLSSVHAVVGLALPGGLRVLAGAQRDALMAVGGMGGGMVYSLRVERSSLAPGFAHFAQRSGVVYLDLNDNGVLDHGEPGLPGIIVRAGSARATTDRSGHYELNADAGAPSVDVRTLEEGMRLGAPAKAGSRDIPVRATSRLDVVVRREESFGRQATVPASIIVSVRDAAGKEWVVVADASGRAHFDALPSGTYLVSAASDNENAPLRIEPVTVRIVAGVGKAPHVELVSRARPIRFQGGTLNSSSTINSTQQQSIGGNGQGVKQ
ncbi:MAG: hypothetical protein P3B98_02930, partial [Gemmatimonadota bacterium]|nr:hypothetical protein [Gemmatimonadota bacterium]